MRNKLDYIPHLQLKINLVVILSALTLILSIIYYVLITYKVDNVIVEGNKHYSAQEIKAMVMSGPYADNSVYLSLKYKNHDIEDIPFIQKMNVKVIGKDSIKISVYEKALAGYVEYLGRYMYFDKDGIIVEVSKVKTKGIPMVSGLHFDHIILYEKLPVTDDSVFQNVLMITQLLNKYGVIADKIYFDDDYHVTLSYNKVKVVLGELSNLDEKMMQLPYILPELEGKSGTLDLENYTEGKNNISFQKD